jgi:ribonuclease HII
MALLGIDEVGRGPWAGPLVIGAVILPDHDTNPWINELTDSKKLSVKKREALNEIILKEAPATGLGWVSAAELDEVGLANALCLAARRAVSEVQKAHVPFNEIIIDGTKNFLVGTKLEKYVTIMPKADFLIKEVSAASIIAKVARDHYMYDLDQKYPEYGFKKHVGYGTAAHTKALKEFGVCLEHRKSFRPIAEIIGANTSITAPTTSTTVIGAKAESIVADYLKSQGHQIIARNHKTKFYEIDIVSTKADKIYFTEVKYRKNELRGTSLDQITSKKQQQMRFAAEAFLKYRQDLQNFSPVLAAAAVSGSDFKLQDWFEII